MHWFWLQTYPHADEQVALLELQQVQDRVLVGVEYAHPHLTARQGQEVESTVSIAHHNLTTPTCHTRHRQVLHDRRYNVACFPIIRARSALHRMLVVLRTNWGHVYIHKETFYKTNDKFWVHSLQPSLRKAASSRDPLEFPSRRT